MSRTFVLQGLKVQVRAPITPMTPAATQGRACVAVRTSHLRVPTRTPCAEHYGRHRADGPPRTRGVTMRSSQWKRSAAAVVSGIVVLLVGVLVYQAGQLQSLRALVGDGYGDEGTRTMVTGAVIGLIGLVTLLVGVWQAAVNIDLAGLMAARALFDEEQAKKAARDERPADPVI